MKRFWLILRWIALIAFALVVSHGPQSCWLNANAQQIGFSSPPGVRVQDEGALQGRATTVNFTGAGVTATVSAGTATVNVPGGGGGGFTGVEVEIDFGSIAVWDATFTITDATISATSKIIITHSGNAATGKEADENEMDNLVCTPRPTAGSFDLFCSGVPGAVEGKFKLFYAVG